MCERDIAANERSARRNRDEFREHRVIVVRLMGSAGAGKTTLLEQTARTLLPGSRIGALNADLVGDRDAVRLRAVGAEAVAVPTGAMCHLDAETVRQALRGTPWREFDYLFIEDIGNLICPAMYDLGQTASVVVISVADGADQPLKYPTIFQKADLVVLTKLDTPVVEQDELDRLRRNLAEVMIHAAMLPLSARIGTGVDEWIRWLRGIERRRGARCAIGPVTLS